MIKAILLKPLDGHPEGSEREFDERDFDALEAMGAVRRAARENRKAAPKPLDKMARATANKAKA